MPMTFPAHQGLILPVARRWPNSFDALALSVGAAMPDITDTILGFLINGYFKQWYGHALIGIFTLDFLGGLFITWVLAVIARRLWNVNGLPSRWQVFLKKAPAHDDSADYSARAQLRVWSFSMFVGILSHIGFDLISHRTNLLFYPWYEHVHWFPDWWYQTWLEGQPVTIFGHPYLVGVYSLSWGALTIIGIFLFFQFLTQTDAETERQ
jgi:hypothetical protein